MFHSEFDDTTADAAVRESASLVASSRGNKGGGGKWEGWRGSGGLEGRLFAERALRLMSPPTLLTLQPSHIHRSPLSSHSTAPASMTRQGIAVVRLV